MKKLTAIAASIAIALAIAPTLAAPPISETTETLEQAEQIAGWRRAEIWLQPCHKIGRTLEFIMRLKRAGRSIEDIRAILKIQGVKETDLKRRFAEEIYLMVRDNRQHEFEYQGCNIDIDNPNNDGVELGSAYHGPDLSVGDDYSIH